MSRIVLGPLPKSLARGWFVRINNIGCGCKCHGIRTLSSQVTTSADYEDDRQNAREWTTQVDLGDQSLQQGFLRPSSLLQLGVAARTTHRNFDSRVVGGHFVNSSFSPVFSNYITGNQFHTSVRIFKEESKVEKIVKALKEQVKQKEEEKQTEDVKLKSVEAEEAVVAPVKKSLWVRLVAELKHYYHGFRLLFIDIKICSRLFWKVLNGNSLTRRERQQLVRTTADMFRLVPFLVFLLVPFMELLLPLAVKLFPNMLPSTFAEKNKEVEKMKKNLKLKLEMAKFLQDTIQETALRKRKKKKGTATEEFSQFVDKIRSQGIPPTTKEILKFAKLFEDEITLDNMSRGQLQAVCRVLNIQPIGIDALLRFQLNMKLRQLKADDQMIVEEGIDSLSVAELQSANRARGMRALGVSNERLKAQLQQWLTLHLDERIPTSLLLLSRALYLPEELSPEEQLGATITELTQKAPTTTEEVKLKAAELAGEEVDNKTRLEVIKKEESIIAAETQAREEEARAEAAQAEAQALAQRQAEAEAEAEVLAKTQAQSRAEQAAMESKEVLKDEAVVLQPFKKEELVDTAPEVTGLAGEELEPAAKEEEVEVISMDESISIKELEEIEVALEEIAQQKQISMEEEELKDLKQEVQGYKEDMEDLKEIMLLSGKDDDDDALQETKSQQRLAKRVDKILTQLDSVVTELQHKEEEPAVDTVSEAEGVAVKTEEAKVIKVSIAEVMEKISDSRTKNVSVDEMMVAMKDAQKVPDESRLQHIMEVLDQDQDGCIEINLALKVLETLGQENVKLTKDQIQEMIKLKQAEMALAESKKKKEEEEKDKPEEKTPKEGKGKNQEESQVGQN